MEEVELSELKINPLNPRGVVVDDESLLELVASIKVHGVLQPILVTPDNTVVAGHRRARAALLAERTTVPVIVKNMSESEQIQIMLIENLQRQTLTTLQTAKAYQSLIQHGLSVRQISLATGFRPSTISNHLAIFDLPEELHAHFDGCLPLSCVRHLLDLSPDKQMEIGLHAYYGQWTIGKIINAVKRERGGKTHGRPVGHYPNPAQEVKKLSPPKNIGEIVEWLETIDEVMDDYPRLKEARTLLRQASRQVISMMEKVA